MRYVLSVAGAHSRVNLSGRRSAASDHVVLSLLVSDQGRQRYQLDTFIDFRKSARWWGYGGSLASAIAQRKELIYESRCC